jgi:hypothetical protein
MNALTTVYATDEDVAIRVPADFTLICPKDQVFASGTDGVFASTDRWTLTSPSVNFDSQAVAPGQVVQLLGPTSLIRPPGDMLVVESVSGNSMVLRRKGQHAGIGQPPVPIEGAMNVEFLIASLHPQIESAAYDLNRRYGIDDLVAGRRSSDLYDPREVRDAVVLTVLKRRYLDLCREGGSLSDTFAAKADAAQKELESLLGRAVVHWKFGESGGAASSTNRFSTRLER